MILPNKNILRLVLKKNLTHISPERKNEASLLACHSLKRALEQTSCEVFAFASKPFEINLWPLLKWLCDEQRLLLPKITQNTIKVYKVPSLQRLRLSLNNIQEPAENFCTSVDNLTQNCLILVPALGFDEMGNRIGHGKGHYDKFLASCPHLTRWGIGLKEQKCNFIPREPHDICMNKVLFF
jgi:5-formyltetrahydrofolate cyclo-ligase